MTEKDLRKMGVKVTVVEKAPNVDGEVVSLANVKGSPADTYLIRGTISKSDGLVKIEWARHLIVDDIFGDIGRERYFELKKILAKKYGDPQAVEFFGRTLYDQRDQFYQCLAYTGCGAYMSLFQPSGGGAISLEVRAKGGQD